MKITRENLMLVFTGLKTEFNKAFKGVTPVWDKIADEVPSTTAAEQYFWVDAIAEVRKWVGDRVVKQLKGQKYTIENEDYELTVSVKKNHVEDDQTGQYLMRARGIGIKGGTFRDREVLSLLAAGTTELCYDGQPFFDADHPVVNPDTKQVESVANIDAGGAGEFWYLLDTTQMIKPLVVQRRQPFEFVAITDLDAPNVFNNKEFIFGIDGRFGFGYSLWQLAYASNQPLTEDNVDAAIDAMAAITNDEGEPLGIVPNLIVVGKSNRAAARKLFKATNNAAGGSNTMFEALEVIHTPRLA